VVGKRSYHLNKDSNEKKFKKPLFNHEVVLKAGLVEYGFFGKL